MIGKKIILFCIATAGFPFAMFANNIDIFGFNIKSLVLLLYLVAITIVIFSKFNEFLLDILNFKMCFALIIYSLASIFWTNDLFYGIRSFLKFTAPFMFLLGTVIVFSKDDDLNKSVRLVYIICMIVSFLAILNVLSGGMIQSLKGTYAFFGLPSLQAPSTSPANFSFLMGSAAIVAFVDFLVQKNIKYLYLFLYFFICVMWAYTRISMVGLIVCMGVTFSMLSNSYIIRFVLPIVLVLAVLIGVFTLSSLNKRMFYDGKSVDIETLVTNPNKALENINTSGRGHLWDLASERFEKEDKLFGAGIGTVDKWLSKLSWIGALHSDYIKVYYDLGLIGLIIYLFTFFRLIRKLLKINGKYTGKIDKKWTAISLGLLTFYLITLFTDNSINYALDFGFYVFFFIGIAWVHGQGLSKKAKNDLIVQKITKVRSRFLTLD